MLPIFLSGVVYAGEKPEIANVRFESVNDKVIVHYYVVRGKRNAATEVVVLPSSSKFT